MAKKQQVEADVLSGVAVNITQAELDACLQSHLDALAAYIRAPRPADGILPPLVAAIRLLKSEIIARDDKLGRGLGHPDAE